MDTAADDRFIDIEEVIRKKNPRLATALPKFLINGFKRIVYQDEINEAIRSQKNEYGWNFVHGILKEFGTNYEVAGIENIPAAGRFIFAANHPLGGLDGLVLMDMIGERFPDIKFIVNDLLLNVKNLEPLLVPVNKYGRQSVEYAHRIEDAYKSGAQILTFPAGLCSRKIQGKITDLPWQKNFIVKSVQFQRDIIPVYVEGRNTNFFYNLANLRKFLGIKMNIETNFLVREMFKQRRKVIKITIGQPIPYTTFDASKTSMDWAIYVREIVYSLNRSYYPKG
jgi:1-acyl-sn-glycerol-3-phosphate acyltransferase